MIRLESAIRARVFRQSESPAEQIREEKSMDPCFQQRDVGSFREINTVTGSNLIKKKDWTSSQMEDAINQTPRIN